MADPIPGADTTAVLNSVGGLQEVYASEGGGGGAGGEVTVTNFPATQPVSGTVTATGPLTNAQLRATAVPVDVTFPAEQPVSIADVVDVSVTNFPATQAVTGTVAVSGSVAVTGPLTNAQLTAQGLLTNDQFTGSTGLLSASPYSDDTGVGDGSVIGLLKGIYVQNAAIIDLLTQIEENTGGGG